MRLIPSIDLRGGQCVRLRHGDFAAETRYDIDPHALIERYAALGALWVHVVDLDGARAGARANHALIGALAAGRQIALQVGGGVRRLDDIESLLELGVQRVVVGSAAVERADEVTGWFSRFGAERLCLAFDVRLDAAGIPRAQTRGWQTPSPLSLWALVERYRESGLRHVLCTDIARDGALGGPNLALYAQALRREPHIAWQASGGIATAADLRALADAGVPAAISGKALLEGRIRPEEYAPYLRDASSPA